MANVKTRQLNDLNRKNWEHRWRIGFVLMVDAVLLSDEDDELDSIFIVDYRRSRLLIYYRDDLFMSCKILI